MAAREQAAGLLLSALSYVCSALFVWTEVCFELGCGLRLNAEEDKGKKEYGRDLFVISCVARCSIACVS